LRFTLAHMATPGRDVKLDEKRIESNRNFMNKIWNAARFVFMNRGDAVPVAGIQPVLDVNKWILAELDLVSTEVNAALIEYRFNEAAGALYNFIWGSYCDWYVEAAKVSLYGDDETARTETQTVMLTALEGWLRLLHPVCPYITETLWQSLHGADARLVSDCAHKVRENHDTDAVRRMRRVIEVVSAIRSIRGEMNVNPGKRIAAVIACDSTVRADLERQELLMKSLARLESLDWLDAEEEVHGAAVAPLVGAKVFLPLAGLIDAKEELARLEKNITRLDKEIGKCEGKLGNPKFRNNAPQAVVAKVQAELDKAKVKHAEMSAAKERLCLL